MTKPSSGPPQLYLASASPRRAELLRQLGLTFTVVNAAVEERVDVDEAPEDYVQRVALAKALAGLDSLGGSNTAPVLGADTEVVLDGEVFGKPQDAAHAQVLLQRLSGRTHRVLSAVALVTNNAQRVIVQHSLVTMRNLNDEECAAYWATGEPRDKAGGYAIQGVGAMFIANLQGSYSGVMGLPLFETAELLQTFGIEILGGGRRA